MSNVGIRKKKKKIPLESLTHLTHSLENRYEVETLVVHFPRDVESLLYCWEPQSVR
jgi:hypothetical protein